MDEMKKVLENDGTYADFLSSNFDTLPKRLCQYLKSDGFDEYMTRLLPEYITRTSLLISSQINKKI